MKKIVTAFKKWISLINKNRREIRFKKYSKMSTEQIFSNIYEKNIWGGSKGEFYSGDGTADPNTLYYIDYLNSFIKEKNIKSILEVGCGDFRIMYQVLKQNPVTKYLGIDVVEALIQHNDNKFSTHHINFLKKNAIKDELPQADLIIIRQVLQHLNNSEINEILKKVNTFKYGIITEHVSISADAVPNIDKITGPHVRTRYNSGVFIDLPPFSLPNTQVVFEFRFDEVLKKSIVPAVIRTYLINNRV
ncbi:MAG: class I SAM-dependent methyltransferase [Chitinophagaceae bacterium]|nr:class I SAM-dependent methyltransferase [Chitinophagaceae bacterium]